MRLRRENLSVGDTKTKKVDVRVIAATNKDLKSLVEKGEFRKDLFYRLPVFTIELPPLRKRGDDIIRLAQSFIDSFSVKMNKTVVPVDDAFFDALRRYSWPGNIRELRNVIERSLILSSGESLDLKDLPIDIRIHDSSISTDHLELASVEKAHICRMLQQTSGNKTEAARLMKIGLSTLYRKMEEYGIHTP